MPYWASHIKHWTLKCITYKIHCLSVLAYHLLYWSCTLMNSWLLTVVLPVSCSCLWYNGSYYHHLGSMPCGISGEYVIHRNQHIILFSSPLLYSSIIPLIVFHLIILFFPSLSCQGDHFPINCVLSSNCNTFHCVKVTSFKQSRTLLYCWMCVAANSLCYKLLVTQWHGKLCVYVTYKWRLSQSKTKRVNAKTKYKE